MKHISTFNIAIAGFGLFSLVYYLSLTLGELGDTKFDDAYMVTRYAKHWLHGEGFSWNAIDGPAYGITSPAYLIVISAVLGVTGCADALALTVTSFVAGLLSVLTLVTLGFLVQQNNWSKKSWIPLLVVPSFLLVPPFRFHSITGMETTFSLLVNSLFACTIVIATRQRSNTALLFCVLSGFLAYETRPDNGVYGLFLPPLLFLATDRQLWRYSICYALLFIALIGCSLFVNNSVFGDFLPLPFFAKASGFYRGYTGVTMWNAMREMLTFFTAALPGLLVIGCKASNKTVLQLVAIAVVMMATFAYYATVTQIMGFQARYYFPSMAFVVLATFIAVFGTAESHRIPSQSGRVGRRLFVSLVILLPVLSDDLKNSAIKLWEKHAINTPFAIKRVTHYRKPLGGQIPRLGWWDSINAMNNLLKLMPRGIVITASEYGFLGTRYPDLTIIDLVGLQDRIIAHHGFSAAYVFSRKPDLIWFPHPDYTDAVAQILDDPTFQQSYDYYPDAYDYGIALRKDSELYSDMMKATEREFARIYPGRNILDAISDPIVGAAKQ